MFKQSQSATQYSIVLTYHVRSVRIVTQGHYLGPSSFTGIVRITDKCGLLYGRGAVRA